MSWRVQQLETPKEGYVHPTAVQGNVQKSPAVEVKNLKQIFICAKVRCINRADVNKTNKTTTEMLRLLYYYDVRRLF